MSKMSTTDDLSRPLGEAWLEVAVQVGGDARDSANDGVVTRSQRAEGEQNQVTIVNHRLGETLVPSGTQPPTQSPVAAATEVPWVPMAPTGTTQPAVELPNTGSRPERADESEITLLLAIAIAGAEGMFALALKRAH